MSDTEALDTLLIDFAMEYANEDSMKNSAEVLGEAKAKLQQHIDRECERARQEPVGDAIEYKVNPAVMKHVLSKCSQSNYTIAKRTLSPKWLVDVWRNGKGDEHDYEVYIWKLKILASLTKRYNWSVFLINDVNRLTKLNTGDSKE